MKVLFLGGKQVGVLCLLTSIDWGCEIKGVVTVSNELVCVAKELELPIYQSVKGIKPVIENCDLLISVHSREIIPTEILALPKLGGINVHPCLYKYKGARPVSRMLEDGETLASVGVHWMIEELDAGEVIVENFQKVKGKIPEEVYSELYPLYRKTLIEALDRINVY